MRRWSTGGSVEYLSPEVFESGKYDASVDWWSLGVVLWEMLSGGVPTNGVLVDGRVQCVLPIDGERREASFGRVWE